MKILNKTVYIIFALFTLSTAGFFVFNDSVRADFAIFKQSMLI